MSQQRELHTFARLQDVLNDQITSVSNGVNDLTRREPSAEAYAQLASQLSRLQLLFQLTDCQGAVVLVEELLHQVSRAIADRQQPDQELVPLLHKGLTQLSHYFGRYAGTNGATPAALIPMINELRARRSATLLSLSGSYSPEVAVHGAQYGVGKGGMESGVSELAKNLRKVYQTALLGVIKGHSLKTNLQYLQKVCERFQEICFGSSREVFWRVAEAYLRSLQEPSADLSQTPIAILRLLDKEIQLLIAEGRQALQVPLQTGLLATLLFYLDQSEVGLTPEDKLLLGQFQVEMVPWHEERGVIDRIDTELLTENSVAVKGFKKVVTEIRSGLANSGVSSPEAFGANLLPDITRLADILFMAGNAFCATRVRAFSGALGVPPEGDNQAFFSGSGEASAYFSVLSAFAEAEFKPAAYRDPHWLSNLTAVLTGFRNGLDHYAIACGTGDFKTGITELLGSLENQATQLVGLKMPFAAKLITLARNVLESLQAADQPDKTILPLLSSMLLSVQEYLVVSARCGKLDEALLDLAKPEQFRLQHWLDTQEEKLPSKLQAVEEPQIVEEAQAIGKTQPVKLSVPETNSVEAVDEEPVDPEIREIFVEEAREVLGTLSQEFPKWRDDPSDLMALKEVRRSFHTLKGSGRMAGASTLGELAWSVEDTLNKVLDSRLSASSSLFQLVTTVIGVLPALVDDYEEAQVRVPADRIHQLIDCARQIMQGEEVVIPDPLVTTSSPMESDTVEEQNQAGEDSFSEEDEDRQLWVIFADEARDYLAIVRGFIAEQTEKAPFFEEITPEVQRALHTLKGSSRIVDVTPIADVVTPLEDLVKTWLYSHSPVDEPFITLLERSVNYFETAIACLLSGERVPDEQGQVLIRQVADLKQIKAGENPLENSSGGHSAADAFLINILSDEMLCVVEADAIMAGWADQALEDKFQIDNLVVQLNKLGELAAGNKYPDVESLARAFALACQSLLSQARSPDSHQLDVLVRAHDELMSMIDAIAALQSLSGADPDLLHQLSVIAGQDVNAQPSATAQGFVLPDDLDMEVVDIFLVEADELLETIEQSLSGWRAEPDSTDHSELLKRALHTFKGGARMAGLDQLATVSHELEATVIGQEGNILNGDTQAFPGMLNEYELMMVGIQQVREALQEKPTLTSEQSEADRPASQVTPSLAEQAPEEVVPFQQAAAFEAGQEDEPRQTAEVIPFAGAFKGLDKQGKTATKTTKGATQEMVRIPANLLELLVNLAGETSIAHSQVEQQVSEFSYALDEMESTIRRLQDQVRRLAIETDAQVIFRREQIEASDIGEGFDPLEMDRYSQLQQLARSLLESSTDVLDLRQTLIDKSKDTEGLLLQQSRIDSELQEGFMRTRLVPFARSAPRLRRLVHQVTQELQKSIRLDIEGAEGEVDRSMLEKITPCLEHMIRNSIDHGIEDAQGRAGSGKPAEAVIQLKFSREGGDIVITLTDDGRGLNLDAIRAKALKQDLIAEDQALSTTELTQMIFRPGFSTSDDVTQISGRGVGMDVVNSEVRQLGGTVNVQSTEGRGTTFTLRLPFTVSVNRALMIKVAGDTYGLALKSIRGVTRISREQLLHLYQHPEEKFEYANELYELRYLGSLLSPELRPTLDTMVGQQFPLVFIRVDDRNYAVHVDGLTASREVVVKSLGYQFSTVPGLSGATILGDGEVVVILDLPGLLRDQSDVQVMPLLVESVPEVQNTAPTVMVVDDSVTVRKVTSRLLEREGFYVITAKDGVDAMRVLQDVTPDVMLLDIEMPRMDGFEVARLVRSIPRLQHLPIIMITSRTGDKHREKAMAIGVDEYLGKPYQEDELLKHVKYYMDQPVSRQVTH